MGTPLRILHVVVNMNRGGAETLLMNLYRNIDKSKIQFDFLTCKPGTFDEEIRELGGRIYRIPYISESGPLGFMGELRKFFGKHSTYRIVHTHLDKMSGLVLREAKKANIRIRIAHSHNTESEGSPSVKLFKWAAGKYITGSATHFYACSQAAADWLFKRQAARTYILKNGIETDQFHFSEKIRREAREDLGIAQDAFVLGHVGRFSEQKNHLYLLDLFAETSKIIPNAVLVLVGDGMLRSKIEEKIKSLNVEGRVKLLGMRTDTNKLHQVFDLFLFPSLHEGLPVTLIEAQGAGLPCLISDRITAEVDMGAGLIKRLSLGDKTTWIRNVEKMSTEMEKRVITTDALAAKGYDIRKTAKETEAAYLALGG